MATPYKEIRDRPLYNELYNKDIGYQAEFIPDNEDNDVTQMRMDNFIIDVIIDIEENGMRDISLLRDVQNTFYNWTVDTFRLMDHRLQKGLKTLLRVRGIYMPINQRQATVAEQLARLLSLEHCPTWPTEELLLEMQNPAFICLQAAELRDKQKGLSYPTPTSAPTSSNSPIPRTAIPTPAPIPAPTPVQVPPPIALSQAPNIDHPTAPNQATTAIAPTTRYLTDLAKLYNDNLKFSGELHDILDIKLKIFYNLCAKASVPEERYNIAFDTMLRGRAETFYYEHLAQKNLSFATMVEKMKAYFHTPENHQLFLNEWRSTMLKDIVANHPEKNLAECLEITIDRLQRAYQGLVQNFGNNEGNLAGQLISACQGVEACTTVLIRPASTFEAVAAELRNAVGVWMRMHPDRIAQYHGSDDEAFYTNRRYFRNDRDRSTNRQFDRSRSRYPQRQGRQDKKCFICGKQGCWSTRHPKNDRLRARRQYEAYQQSHKDCLDYEIFLADFEGMDIDGDSDNDNDDRNRNLDTYYNRSDQFFTSICGPINGQSIITALYNSAVTHAVTGEDRFNVTPKAEAHVFSFESRYNGNIFQGIMPDTGAAGVSTAGKPQVIALQREQPSATIDRSTAGRHRIRFGNSPECISIGDVTINTPFGLIKFAVMPTNTPFLLCLADMDRYDIYLNNVDNALIHKGKSYPIVRKWGHPWLLLDNQETAAYHLTEVELRQLHRRFGHPATERLYKVLNRAGYSDLDKDIIEKINKFCHQCQIHSKAPGRFRFTLRDDNIDFNSQLIVDVMYINQKPVLHAIDEATAFQAARFMPNISAATTWDLLRSMWIDTYVGPPDIITTDAGKNFVSQEFIQNAQSMAIEVIEVPVEAHNSIGKVERYHATIRRAYEVISADIGRTTTSDNILQMAVKAVNDTAGPDGLVPTLLVFGTYPRLSKLSPPSPSIIERAAAIKKAMAEIRKLKANRQINDALAMRNGPDVTRVLRLPILSDVKVWRENKGWTGPHTLVALNRDQTSAIVEISGHQTTFRITAVRPYYQDESTAEGREDNDQGTDDNSDDNFEPEPEPEQSEQGPEQPRRRGRPKGSKNKPKATDSTYLLTETNLDLDLDLDSAYTVQREHDDIALAKQLRAEGKITTPGQPFEQSTKSEIESLIGRGVFRFEIYDPTKYDDIHVFKSRIVNEIKGKADKQPYEKSRLVIQGYNDHGKKVILTQSPTIQRSSQRIIIALAPSLIRDGMTLWLRDITQAYTQSDDPLQRTIIAELPTPLRNAYPEGTVMVVVKPLYGIAEAGAHWWSTYFKHHIERLNMETSTYDPCLLISKPTAPRSTNSGFGIVGMQTDDTLGLSDRSFAAKEAEELRFSAKDKAELTIDDPIVFNGCIVSINLNGDIILQQKRQGEKLELTSDQQSYIQQRARGAYIATICQPEASFDLASAAQATEPSKEEISRLNKRIKWQKDHVDRGLKYVQLDLKDLKLFTIVDASFANNKDLSSQLGFVIVLGNEIKTADTTSFNTSFKIRGNIVHWSSTKCKRITRSVLASEIYAMANGVDIAIAIGSTINIIAKRLQLPQVPIVVCTDSLSLYECLVKLGTTKEKRLMIDIMALREAYEHGDLADIRWIDGRDNPADCMTKSGPNAAMERLINTNEVELRVQGWVNRDTNRDSDY